MNFNGIDLYLNDKRYEHFQSLTKEEQESKKQTIKQYIQLNLYNDILNNIDDILDEKNKKHFNSLPKSQQEAIKQVLILKMLNNEFDT